MTTLRSLASFIALLTAVAVLRAGGEQDRRLPLPGQAPAGPAPRLGLVVGNDDYATTPLRNAAADARAIAATLRDLGFTVTELPNATTPTLDRAVRDIAGRLTPQSEVVFFYAGHGVQIEGENYLIPVDFAFAGADAVDVKTRALAASTVLERLAAARVRVVMLDACRDNPFAATRSAAGGLAALQAAGALVAFATGAGQTASDNPSGANGLFTTHLLTLMREPGLSAVDLFRGVRQRVYDASGGKQMPWLWDGLLGDFVFNRATPVRRNLTVETTPPGSSVLVDGQPRGLASPQLIVSGLSVGEHDVAARHEGYAEVHRRVTMAADADASVSLTLAAESGGVRIETTPAGAQVVVDGVIRGVAPLDLAGLAPGAHRVEATLGGYVPYYGDVSVRAGETAPVRASLARETRAGADATTGILHVTSDPSGAQAYLDGLLIGTTPHTQEGVPVGGHKVRVTKTYYAPVETAIDIAPKVVARRDEKLQLLPAALTIESDFGTGTLSIDGRRIGALAATQTAPLSAGPHQVRVDHPTAGAMVQEVELLGGPQRVALRKASWLGAVTILSDVALRELTVGGRTAGLPPLTVVDLPKGATDISGSTNDGRATRGVDVVAGDTIVVRLTSADVKPFGPAELNASRLGVRWARIPAGTFQMGCVPEDSGCAGDEQPRHAVTLTKSYDLMTTEVTLGMFRGYAAATGRSVSAQPDWNSNDRQPVVNVTWDEASAFCGWAGGRLPTEAEWERAARGGTDGTKYPWGDQAPVATVGANNGARFNSQSTLPVGQFAANAFGLFDMAGNVWEWVADWYGPYAAGSVRDPRGPSSGDRGRVVRGGSWYFNPRDLRVSSRNFNSPGDRSVNNGFRCARDVFP